ncbi:MAG: (2Fe-2S) ferredoxin domain-containing protein [Omnitrophica WOR_2 bacterium]
MPSIKSLDDLKRIRAEALEKREAITKAGKAQIFVATGTCGIAAGALDTLKSIVDYIETNNLSGISVTQTGCIGLCEKEPIVQVILGDQPKITYGKVTPGIAEQIMKDHILGGEIIKESVIQI